MGDVVNLRRIRKARDRAARAEVADHNRAAFGRSAEERASSAAARAAAEVALDRHRRVGPDDEPAGRL